MPNNLQYGKRGLALTQSFEGLRLKAYQDIVGVWTIGYGHTGKDVHPGMVITQDQAAAYLLEDIQAAVKAVNRLVTAPLTQEEFDGLVDFTFNCGDSALAKSTLLRMLNAGDLKGAAEQMLLWNHAGGKVVAGLLRRRQAEQDLFKTKAVEK